MTNNKTKSLKNTAYLYIVNLILEGEVLPGDILDEKLLSSNLNVSRTPVREALQKLSDEKFVTIIPRKCTMVSHISISDVQNLYQARKMFEPKIVLEVADFVDKNELIKFRNIFEDIKKRKDFNNENDWDYEFHLYLAKCTNNEIISELVEQLMLQSRRIRVLSNVSNEGRLINSLNEHLEIINALIANDGDRASKLLLEHLKSSEEGYQNIYQNKTYFTL